MKFIAYFDLLVDVVTALVVSGAVENMLLAGC